MNGRTFTIWRTVISTLSSSRERSQIHQCSPRNAAINQSIHKLLNHWKWLISCILWMSRITWHVLYITLQYLIDPRYVSLTVSYSWALLFFNFVMVDLDLLRCLLTCLIYYLVAGGLALWARVPWGPTHIQRQELKLINSWMHRWGSSYEMLRVFRT